MPDETRVLRVEPDGFAILRNGLLHPPLFVELVAAVEMVRHVSVAARQKRDGDEKAGSGVTKHWETRNTIGDSASFTAEDATPENQ